MKCERTRPVPATLDRLEQQANFVFPENMRPELAAQYLGLSTPKLAKLRMASNLDDGPRFVKHGGTAISRKIDLVEWFNANLVGSGGDAAGFKWGYS